MSLLEKIENKEIEFEEVEDGIVNTTYITSNYVVQKNRDGSDEKLKKNAYLIEKTFENGVNTAKVVEKGKNPVNIVFEKLEGTSLNNKNKFTEADFIEAGRNAGKELAKIHQVKADNYGKPQPDNREIGEYKNWRNFCKNYIDGTIEYVTSNRFQPLVEKAEEMIELTEISEKPDSRVLHLDYTPDNIIIDDETLEAYVIDFDNARYGEPGFDYMYAAEIIMPKHSEKMAEAFKEGYQSVRDLKLSENEVNSYLALAVMRDARGGEWCYRNDKDVDLDAWAEGLNSVLERNF